MKSFVEYLTSSVGRKQTLGLAGALLVAFLGVHALGNLKLLDPDPVASQAAYNAYTEFLTHTMRPFVWFAELGLVALLSVHVLTGIALKLSNRRSAGSSRYAVRADCGGEGLPARTMFLTGSLVILFLVDHLSFIKYGTHFVFRDSSGALIRDMWLTVALSFGNPAVVALDSVALVILGVHLWHALPSVCRTFGLAHEKWTPVFNLCGRLVAVGLAGIFLAVALGTFALSRTPRWKARVAAALASQPQPNVDCPSNAR